MPTAEALSPGGSLRGLFRARDATWRKTPGRMSSIGRIPL